MPWTVGLVPLRRKGLNPGEGDSFSASWYNSDVVKLAEGGRALMTFRTIATPSLRATLDWLASLATFIVVRRVPLRRF